MLEGSGEKRLLDSGLVGEKRGRGGNAENRKLWKPKKKIYYMRERVMMDGAPKKEG